MLVKPFTETDAYRLGIIDKTGKNLIKPSSFNTSEQKDAYTLLHRLVFNMKKIINKLPGGESKLKSLTAAYFLVKEYYEKNERSTSLMEHRFYKLMQSGVYFAEETILIEKYMKELEEDGAAIGGTPANSTTGVAGLSTATGGPVVKKKDINKYKKGNVTGPVAGVTRRATPLA
jgi:hypothetical protein